MKRFSMGLFLAVFATAQAGACTIFVLTNGKQTLFCNNEDWSDPATFIWFKPGSGSRLGCAYVGFGNQWAQGGVNTAGLAFDWVAGFREKWSRDPKMKNVSGNTAERMLESCRTVDEAIAFYQNHWEPDLGRSWVLVADRSGASAIIGAKEGKLHVQRDTTCRGFGFGRRTLEKTLPQQPTPDVGRAFEILSETAQTGKYATKYACVYDLAAGEIFIEVAGSQAAPVKLVLTEELAKGRHIYELSRLSEQLSGPLKRPSRWKETKKTVGSWFRD
jgi:hypothetical protein